MKDDRPADRRIDLRYSVSWSLAGLGIAHHTCLGKSHTRYHLVSMGLPRRNYLIYLFNHLGSPFCVFSSVYTDGTYSHLERLAVCIQKQPRRCMCMRRYTHSPTYIRIYTQTPVLLYVDLVILAISDLVRNVIY